MTYSKRDQLSLCYVLWANHINSVELLLPHGVSTHNYEAIKRVKHNPNSLWKRIQGAVKELTIGFCFVCLDCSLILGKKVLRFHGTESLYCILNL